MTQPQRLRHCSGSFRSGEGALWKFQRMIGLPSCQVTEPAAGIFFHGDFVTADIDGDPDIVRMGRFDGLAEFFSVITKIYFQFRD